MAYGLSKSKIMAGLQCPRRLYLAVHVPELADHAAAEHAFNAGHLVGETAKRLFPDGHLIQHDDELNHALQETATCMQAIGDKTLFEATFEHDGVLVRVDVLRSHGEGIELIEVKSSTDIKDHYVYDCAIQAWVLTSAGFAPSSVQLAHIDNTFVYPGNGHYEGLLKYVDLTEAVSTLIQEVSYWVSDSRAILAGKEPEVEVGEHCHNPHDCPFMQHCWPPEPKYPVTLLPREKGEARALQEEGHADLREVPPGRLTNPDHERIRRVTRNGEAELLPGAGEALQALPYPRYYLDFETMAFAAIPIWKGTRPYEAHLPFQWSCHIERDDNTMDHAEFLDTSGEPPMRALAEKLIATLENKGTVFMYSSFERSVISKLAEMFPDLSEALERIAERLFDLLPLVRKHYYHPNMKGSWSIKAVLPTIAPDLKYDDLGDIQDGIAASSAFMEIVSGPMDAEDKARAERALLEYCKLDTLAMVRLVRFLQEW